MLNETFSDGNGAPKRSPSRMPLRSAGPPGSTSMTFRVESVSTPRSRGGSQKNARSGARLKKRAHAAKIATTAARKRGDTAQLLLPASAYTSTPKAGASTDSFPQSMRAIGPVRNTHATPLQNAITPATRNAVVKLPVLSTRIPVNDGATRPATLPSVF